MRKQTISDASFHGIFDSMLPRASIAVVVQDSGCLRRRPPQLKVAPLIESLVFHAVAGPGSFAQHVKQLTGQTITDGALSQRRARLPKEVFEQLLAEGLEPLADPRKHAEAFYRGWRLCGIDGTRFSVANTPTVKRTMRKAKSRRGRAAFAQVGAAVVVELGLHNPVAATMGGAADSEMDLARRLWHLLPKDALLIADRYYGVGEVLVGLAVEERQAFLVRVRSNLKPRYLESYPDGTALVEICSSQGTRLVREIVVEIRCANGRKSTVRLWTSLLDWKEYPAGQLAGLYARRWEQEGFYRELKIDTRSLPQLASHTELTALQEVAALILGYAVLVRHRIEAATLAEVQVVRISFMKTLHIARGLWQFLELSADLLSPADVRTLVRRAMTQIADMAISKRRARSCPRAVRQPVGSWPRLVKNTYVHGTPNITVIATKPTNI